MWDLLWAQTQDPLGGIHQMCPDNVPAQSPGTGHCGLGQLHAHPPHICPNLYRTRLTIRWVTDISVQLMQLHKGSDFTHLPQVWLSASFKEDSLLPGVEFMRLLWETGQTSTEFTPFKLFLDRDLRDCWTWREKHGRSNHHPTAPWWSAFKKCKYTLKKSCP